MSVLKATTSAPTSVATLTEHTSAPVRQDSVCKIRTCAEMWTNVRLDYISVASRQEPLVGIRMDPMCVCVKTATKRMNQDSRV